LNEPHGRLASGVGADAPLAPSRQLYTNRQSDQASPERSDERQDAKAAKVGGKREEVYPQITQISQMGRQANEFNSEFKSASICVICGSISSSALKHYGSGSIRAAT
jgi:hypothetical protein